MSAASVQMPIRLDVTAREKLKAIALRQKRTSHALAIEAINQLIAQKKGEYAWDESCDAALKHSGKTGLLLRCQLF